MDKKRIQKTLAIFAKRAKKKFDAEKVILFGSYARGQATAYSDIDIIVLSKKFSSIPKEKRLDALYPLTTDLYPDVHPFGFTPREFVSAKRTSTLFEIQKTGVTL
jgi:predicted nucleotidyltransferase